MRPTTLTIAMLVLASGLCMRASAQVGQRAPQLRSAQTVGPTTAQTGVQTATQNSPQPGLGDAAWTSSPIQQQSRGQSPLVPSHPIDSSSRVVPAQFTSSDAPVAHVPATSNSAALPTAPRPLKPPTSTMDSASRSAGAGTFQMLVSVISSLMIVIALIVGAGWCYRKAAPKLTGALPKEVVHVLGRTQLAPRQQLVLIRFGSKILLVSNLQGEVRTISELTDPLEVDQIAGLCESARPDSISQSFRSVLQNIGRNGT